MTLSGQNLTSKKTLSGQNLTSKMTLSGQNLTSKKTLSGQTLVNCLFVVKGWTRRVFIGVKV